MKIRIDVEGTRMTATLEDNATARDFASLLPLTLTLEDYSATEKISDLPKRLSTKDAPPRRMWTTFVLVRTADGWRISAIRNMAPTGNP